MRLLLDSHALFWAISDHPKLSVSARTLILDNDNDIFYSPVSLYEITFKANRGRMPAAAMHLPETVKTSGSRRLPSSRYISSMRRALIGNTAILGTGFCWLRRPWKTCI